MGLHEHEEKGVWVSFVFCYFYQEEGGGLVQEKIGE